MNYGEGTYNDKEPCAGSHSWYPVGQRNHLVGGGGSGNWVCCHRGCSRI